MALNWTWHIGPWSRGPEIEANRISDAKKFLVSRGYSFEIYDPKIKRNIVWVRSSRYGILKFWSEMSRLEKIDMQNKRKNTLPDPSKATEVIDI